jgi:hypothetical protein
MVMPQAEVNANLTIQTPMEAAPTNAVAKSIAIGPLQLVPPLKQGQLPH